MNNEHLSQEEIDALLKGESSEDSSQSVSSESSDRQMSQEEIEALLSGEVAPAPSSAEDAKNEPGMDVLMEPLDEYKNANLPQLTDIERDAMGEIGNISMGTAATTLAVLLGRRVSITTPRVTVTTLSEMRKKYPLPCLLVEVAYKAGVSGTNLLTIQEKDALIIATLMMGGDGLNPPAELNEIYLSAVAESMNQMMGSTATSLSTVFKKKVDIAPPSVSMVNFGSDSTISNDISEEDPVVRVSFRMEVENLIDSDLTQILPYGVAQEMVQNLMEAINQQPKSNGAEQQPQKQPAPSPKAKSTAAQPQVAVAQSQVAAAPPPGYVYQQQQPVAGIQVQPVQFQPLAATIINGGESNIGLIMDVPLQVTVELGRTKKLIRDILDLSPGAVVELDKLAGEPVDILVNGKLIAKGEVVVIDENFGVRITYICNQAERVSTLQ